MKILATFPPSDPPYVVLYLVFDCIHLHYTHIIYIHKYITWLINWN